MSHEPQIYLKLMVQLIAFSAFLQNVEMMMILKKLRASKFFSWEVIRADFSKNSAAVRYILDLLCSSRNFQLLQYIGAAAALTMILWPNPFSCLVLIGQVLLTSLRWRGNFNGGSDSMTLTVLLGSFTGLLFYSSPVVVQGALFYVAIHIVLSYFIAGLVKLRHREWRNGNEFERFLNASSYPTPMAARALFQTPRRQRLAAWAIIVFECGFPLALWNPQAAGIWLTGALFFHAANAWALGLNRFFWAWTSGFPAVVYLSQFL